MIQRFLILLLIGLACCKTKTDVVLPPVKLVVDVVDTNNKPLTISVPVYLFNDSNKYHAASDYYTGIGAILADSTINSQCTFEGIPTNNAYYVYAHYRNYTTLQGGYYIDYDNSDNFTISQAALNVTPIANTTPQITAKVIMKPVNGLVSFWTPANNSEVLPIEVVVDNNVFGTVNTTFGSEPFYTNNGVINGLVRNGSHKYKATSGNGSGCVWKDSTSIIIKGGENLTIQIPECKVGSITFWSDTSNKAALPIDIIIGISDTIGTITQTFTGAPSCSSSEIAPYSNDAKDSNQQTILYKYQMKSRTTGCYSVGTFTIIAGQCNSIKLPTCEN